MVNYQFFFSNTNTYFFLVHNSDRDFYSENNVGTTSIYLHNKNTKKNATIAYALHFVLNWRHLCAIPMLLFVISFSSLLNLVITHYTVAQCILIASRLVFVICFKS
jgi:hypothetical protein